MLERAAVSPSLRDDGVVLLCDKSSVDVSRKMSSYPTDHPVCRSLLLCTLPPGAEDPTGGANGSVQFKDWYQNNDVPDDVVVCSVSVLASVGHIHSHVRDTHHEGDTEKFHLH